MKTTGVSCVPKLGLLVFWDTLRSILFDNGDIVQCIAKPFRYHWCQNIELVKIYVLEPYRTDKNDTKQSGSEFGTNIIFKHEPGLFFFLPHFSSISCLMPYLFHIWCEDAGDVVCAKYFPSG